jgi:hypothetical protein
VAPLPWEKVSVGSLARPGDNRKRPAGICVHAYEEGSGAQARIFASW